MWFTLLSFLAVFTVSAQTNIDQRLQGYIKDFNLKPLDEPTQSNSKLLNLGHRLFADRILSGNNNISCVECHHPRNMTMDGLPLGLGEGAEGIQVAGNIRSQKSGQILARNTPALFNLNGINVMFWDGRVSYDPRTQTVTTPVPLAPEVSRTLTSALAAQALFPIVTHEEMRGQPGSNKIADAKSEAEAWNLIVEKVLREEDYKKAFEEIYPGEKINIGHIGEAIAEFQRFAFFYADTPYDSYLKGDVKALNEVQKMGMDIFFGKGKCGECHQGEHLSNFEFHSIGVPQIGPGKVNGDDYGRYEWDQSEDNMYAFRVPPLRNVALTAPYMHNGAFKTLPQVVEHYDLVVESFTEYSLVNNWKSYIEKITGPDHSKDELRKAALSTKLTTHIGFEENEEKALSEFLASALTDKNLMNREVDGNYSTYFRMQLRPSGYAKLNQKFQGSLDHEVFYYFDTLLEGGYYLRSIANPIRLILIKRSNGTELTYREQVFKTAVADKGIVIGGNFNREETKMVDETLFDQIESSYVDMFNRIYTYHDGTRADAIPVSELSIIKSDMDKMNENFHHISFEGANNISDIMNQSKDEVYYVPTSYNTKDTNTFMINVDGKDVKCILQESVLRTETGGLETTWAIEFETSKISKVATPDFAKKILSKLDLESTDVGGGSPSPSRLTLEVIDQIIK